MSRFRRGRSRRRGYVKSKDYRKGRGRRIRSYGVSRGGIRL